MKKEDYWIRKVLLRDRKGGEVDTDLEWFLGCGRLDVYRLGAASTMSGKKWDDSSSNQ